MLALGEHVGRQVSHDIVYEAAMAAFEQRRPLRNCCWPIRGSPRTCRRRRSTRCCGPRPTPAWRGSSWIESYDARP